MKHICVQSRSDKRHEASSVCKLLEYVISRVIHIISRSLGELGSFSIKVLLREPFTT
jgi:hypothetical protein